MYPRAINQRSGSRRVLSTSSHASLCCSMFGYLNAYVLVVRDLSDTRVDPGAGLIKNLV